MTAGYAASAARQRSASALSQNRRAWTWLIGGWQPAGRSRGRGADRRPALLERDLVGPLLPLLQAGAPWDMKRRLGGARRGEPARRQRRHGQCEEAEQGGGEQVAKGAAPARPARGPLPPCSAGGTSVRSRSRSIRARHRRL